MPLPATRIDAWVRRGLKVRAWAVLATSLALAAAGCSGDDGGGERSGGQTGSTVQSTTVSSVVSQRPRAAARWEQLATFSGTGNEPRLAVALSLDVIQWRVRWTCEGGNLRIETTPAPRKPGPLVDSQCPANGEAFSTLGGDTALDVEASASWTVVVDQQVDTPLAEPPLPEMANAPAVLQGSFHDLEKKGSGSARLYDLPGGRRVLRLEDFSVSQNTDLFVWLSEAADPKNSAEAVDAPKVVLAELRSTLGSQNYEIPADLPTERIRSVVIWCVPVAVAYSAAPLIPPPA